MSAPRTGAPVRHFLDLLKVPGPELRDIMDASAAMKAARVKGQPPIARPLAGKTLAMIFDRPSTRTRVSFDLAMRELGGETIMLTGAEMQLGRGESIPDTARVLSRYVDAIMIRILDHEAMEELARHATVPVINGLTKQSHPCQVMADILTFEEHCGAIRGRKIAWSGDYNNVLSSWIDAAQRFDFSLDIACPRPLQPRPERLEEARALGAKVTMGEDPFAAVAGAAAVISDCWVSMGDEDEGRRHNLLAPYQVNAALMGAAATDAIFMHCLPAHRGEEVTDEVIDGPQSAVFDEAENRLHAQKGILAWCLGAGRPMNHAPPSRAVSDAAQDDIVVPFLVEPLSTRGRVVRLGPAIDAILKRHAYPAPIARIVGEAAALTVLLGTALKIEGSFQLQTKTDGALNMLIVDFDAPSNLRALARFDAAKLAQAGGAGRSGELLGSGHLAFTIDPGAELSRYQGVIGLDGQGLEEAAHQYFLRSEQIPTLVRLAVGEVLTPTGAHWRAGGLIAQFLPELIERRRQADLDPGDAPPGAARDAVTEDDHWTEAKALAATTEDHELLDPTLSSERLLYRLFHERGVRVFEPGTLRDACRCSTERIDAMLHSFSPAERADMVGDDGMIGVTCEFCSTKRIFDPADYEKA